MQDIAVIDEPAAAALTLDPIRGRLLAELAHPASASMLAPRVGLTRQKVNYHLRALEEFGLVELVEERAKGNMTERVLQASAAAYVISPQVISALSPDASRHRDQASARWLLALGSRLVGELGTLIAGASAAKRLLPTFAVDADIRFASAADRAQFAKELGAAINSLAAKYHHPDTAGGRDHRLVVGLHPSPKPPPSKESQP